jgi:DNA (cytosine-5)-methyltransferase 1
MKASAGPCQSGRGDGLSAQGVLDRIDELLELAYRSADLGNLADPLDEAVFILISAQTREQVYRRVFASLKATYPRWVDVLSASRGELERVLKPAGFQVQRASKLAALFAAIERSNIDQGLGPAHGDDLTLEFLHRMSDEEAAAFLVQLPGIGPKSARCILAYSLGRDTFAVDTHVRRILERLELIERRSGKPAHGSIEGLIPKRQRVRLHINLVHHGRAVCLSGRPRCQQCFLVSFCPTGQATVSAKRERPIAVELFAGAGGLGLGFSQAGFQIGVAVEQDRDAAQTYRLNHPGVPVLEADVTKIREDDLDRVAPGISEPDIMIAGPPCQGYSHAGSRDPNAPANGLYKHVSRLAKLLKPKLVLVENVPGVRRVNGVVGFEQRIRRSIANAGYNIERPAMLRAADFGVSQNRRRLVFIGRREDLGPPPPLPEPTHRVPGEQRLTDMSLPETPRLADLLRRLPELPPGVDCEHGVVDGKEFFNASTMAHSKAVIDKISKIKPGDGPISYRRLEMDLARTLIAGHRALPVHPWLHRTISVREAAVIQGFPEWFVFAGSRANQPLQVANAVPPPLAYALARHLLHFLTEE